MARAAGDYNVADSHLADALADAGPRVLEELTAKTDESGGTSYSLLRLVDDGPRRPPAQVYGVFARPAAAADEDAGADWDLLPLGDDVERGKGLDFGRVRPGSARLLLRIAGGSVGLVAVTTTAGAVCFGLEPEGGGSCGFPHADGFDLAAQDAAQGLLVFGLVPDGVDALDIVAAGTTTRAKLGENGFAVRLPHEFSALEAAVLHRRDGEKERIPIGIP
jgi:hypothetical protein